MVLDSIADLVFLVIASFCFFQEHSNLYMDFVVDWNNTNYPLSILCSISSLSALEELLITMKSKELNRDIKCIFYL